MQWNQPFGNYGFQSYPQSVLPYLQIVGEGDVTSITFSDGSVQFYFLPTIRHDQLPYHCNVKLPYSSLTCWPTSTEAWIIRSIINTQANVNISVPPGYFNGKLQNAFGECSLPSSKCCVSTPIYSEHFQKFHHDSWTSTTDIHYFYPNLRREVHLHYCTETQTDTPFHISNIDQNKECNKPCHCMSSLRLRDKYDDVECACRSAAKSKSNVSCMSVDSLSGTDKRKNKKRKKTATKNRRTYKREHICECEADIKDTSDKLVTTYADQASGNVTNSGRETQTERQCCKRSGINTEIWVPVKKRQSKSNSTLKIVGSCDSCCHSNSCPCSTSETDGV